MAGPRIALAVRAALARRAGDERAAVDGAAAVGASLLLEGATYERQVIRLRAAAVRLASLR